MGQMVIGKRSGVVKAVEQSVDGWLLTVHRFSGEFMGRYEVHHSDFVVNDLVEVSEIQVDGESTFAVSRAKLHEIMQDPQNIVRLPGETLLSWAERLLRQGKATDNKLACLEPIFSQMKTLLKVADSLLEEVEPTDPEFRPESSLTERERNIMYFRGMYRDTLCKP